MSIEKLLTELIEAVKENTAALTSGELKDVPADIAHEGKGKDAKKTETTAKTDKAADKTKGKKDEAEEQETDGVTYDEVKAKTLATSKAKGREFVASILEKFGKHESAKTLKPAQWADYTAALDEEPEDEDMA